MPIVWRTDYALRIMYEAACLGEGHHASVHVLAKRADVPYGFARQIANRLNHAGLLKSRRGSRGGFFLARPAAEITILQVFEAMGERLTMALCTQENLCSRQELCPVHHDIWLPLDEMIKEHFRTVTLADVIAAGKRIKAEKGPLRTDP